MTTDNQSEEPLRTALREAIQALPNIAADYREIFGQNGRGPFVSLPAVLDRLLAAQPTPALDADRLAIAAAARLEGEVSRLRTELVACTEAQSTLDAERLARAFTIVQPGVYGDDWPRDDPDDFQFVNPRDHALAIAAEYARLAPAPHWPTPPVATSDELRKENPMNDDTRRLLTDLREHLRNCDPLAATQSRGQMAGQVPPSATPHRRAANALRRRLDEALALGGRDDSAPGEAAG